MHQFESLGIPVLNYFKVIKIRDTENTFEKKKKKIIQDKVIINFSVILLFFNLS